MNNIKDYTKAELIAECQNALLGGIGMVKTVGFHFDIPEDQLEQFIGNNLDEIFSVVYKD